MLEVRNLAVSYGDFQVLWGIDLVVHAGEVVSLLGPNGAGKSTVLNTISGLLKPREGSVTFRGVPIHTLPSHEIVSRGLVHILERRRVFPYLSVRQNLWLGGYHPTARQRRAEMLEKVYRLFPRLHERENQLAHSLSGGEQQMLVLGRGLMACPKLLTVDEPFLGLSPGMQRKIVETFEYIRESHVSILFIEQNVQTALNMSDRGYILENGKVALSGPSQRLLKSAQLKHIFMGN